MSSCRGGAGGKYFGLTEEAKAAYDDLHEEALHWGSRVYVYPDCSRAFRMDARLDLDAKRIADRLSYGGWHTISGRPFWETIEPFCVSKPGNPETIDHWHHGEILVRIGLLPSLQYHLRMVALI